MVFNPGVEIQEKFRVWNVWEVPQSSLGWTGQFQLQPPQPVGPHRHRGLPAHPILCFQQLKHGPAQGKGAFAGTSTEPGLLLGNPPARMGWAESPQWEGAQTRRSCNISIPPQHLCCPAGLGQVWHTPRPSPPQGGWIDSLGRKAGRVTAGLCQTPARADPTRGATQPPSRLPPHAAPSPASDSPQTTTVCLPG